MRRLVPTLTLAAGDQTAWQAWFEAGRKALHAKHDPTPAQIEQAIQLLCAQVQSLLAQNNLGVEDHPMWRSLCRVIATILTRGAVDAEPAPPSPDPFNSWRWAVFYVLQHGSYRVF